jgi:hypothetical protein
MRATAGTSSTTQRIRCSAPSSAPRPSVNGIQGEGVISTLKHYTLNCNETNRHWLDTQSSTRTRTASLTCSPSRSRSSARSPAPSCAATTRSTASTPPGKSPPAQRGAQRRLGLARLGDVRLGRHRELGLRAEGAGPGIRRAEGHEALEAGILHRAAQEGIPGRQRQAAEEAAAVRHGTRCILRSMYSIGIDK